MKHKKLIISLSIILIIIIAIVASGAIYFGNYYHANEFNYDDDCVEKIEHDGYIEYNTNSNKGIIFYPGAKVEYTAYEPLMYAIAEMGFDCFLVDMPLNFALLGTNKASDVIEENKDIEDFYMMGHSLGGVAAASYTKDNSDIKGLILLASYSTKEIEQDTLLIYGSLDGVMNKKNYEDSKEKYSNYTERVIEGGNHGQFGYYGFQSGDNKATISDVRQWNLTAQYIYFFIY